MVEGAFERRRAARRRLLRRGVLIATAVAAAGVAVWAVAVVGIDTLVEKILSLPAWLVVSLVFLLPALEASAFVGIVFPGEIAVLLGGVVASHDRVPIAAVVVAACLGAAVGDQVGYLVGREWGQQLLRKIPDRLLDEDRLQRGRAYIRRLGAKGVVLGRWTAALRALVPGLAGMAHMHYVRFLAANVAGGTLWATAVAMVGYVAGDNWHAVQKAVGDASYALLGAIVLVAVVLHLVRRRRERRWKVTRSELAKQVPMPETASSSPRAGADA